ncbi:RNA polymerase sigma-70 factor [Parapedobacter tibetensis]|uniref:RNA polymerase sigma-70 factor n=1 Tax=Parapedobacter tibetensis TaxID=2972951 RepID=UPI00214D1F86|nr:RNA polymerase sigma-70 factor [Parapedobacter tibetensis]
MSEYKEYTDIQLVTLLKVRNEEAFAEIFDRYWGILYIHAQRMLQDEMSAKDVVQEVFIGLWKKSAILNVHDNLSSYLFVAVRNKVLNLIRDNKVRTDYTGLFAMYIEEYAHETLDQLYEKELLEVIEEVVQSLPERMRQVFELSRKEYLSHRQIAERLHISEKTVKRQVSNALQVLRAQLLDK